MAPKRAVQVAKRVEEERRRRRFVANLVAIKRVFRKEVKRTIKKRKYETVKREE